MVNNVEFYNLSNFLTFKLINFYKLLTRYISQNYIVEFYNF